MSNLQLSLGRATNELVSTDSKQSSNFGLAELASQQNRVPLFSFCPSPGQSSSPRPAPSNASAKFARAASTPCVQRRSARLALRRSELGKIEISTLRPPSSEQWLSRIARSCSRQFFGFLLKFAVEADLQEVFPSFRCNQATCPKSRTV